MKTNYNRIGVKAIDRGGSNLILALFHYHDGFYSLNEKITCDINDTETLPSIRTSVFNDDDTHKSISTSKNLVQKMPRETTSPYGEGSFKYDYYDYEYDKILCILRNPFRVAVSSYLRWFSNSHNEGKNSFDIKNALLYGAIDWTNERLIEIKNGEIDKFICLEYFVNKFETELPKLIKWADEDASPIISRNIGQLYFETHIKEKKSWVTIDPLHGDIKKSWLTSGRKTYAGSFEPRQNVSLHRLIYRDINDYLSHDAVEYAREKLPYYLFEYWYNDTSHNYEVDLTLNLA